MRKPINLIVYTLWWMSVWLLGCIPNSWAETADSLTPVNQQEAISLRKFDSASLGQYKSDPDFNYVTDADNEVKEYEFNWISRLLRKLFGISFNKDTSKIWEVIVYIFCGAVLLFALFHLLKADKSWFLVGSSRKTKINIEEVETNIHEMDMDLLINQAIEQKQYRRAVRLLYLKTLKELNNKNLIDWSAQKTNSDYLNELKPGAIKENFKSNTLVFEYIWYGNFQIDEPLLFKVKASFDKLYEDINRK